MKKRPVTVPKNRAEQHELKKKGNIMGHMKLKVGRPPKESSSSAAAASAAAGSTANTKTAASSSAAAAAAAAVSTSASASVSNGTKRKGVSLNGPKKKSRKQNVKWELHPEILQAHVDVRGTKKVVPLTDFSFIPPRSTVSDYIRRLNKHEEATGEKLSVAEWIEQHKQTPGPPSIISKEVRDRIQNIIVARDARNNPLKRLDIIEIISSVAGCSQKQADNYYCYCVSHNKFPMLKKGGKVATCQKTTTSRTQVTVQQQHRWHIVIDDTWEKQAETNLSADEFKPIHA